MADEDEFSAEQSFGNIPLSPFVLDITTPSASQSMQAERSSPTRTPTRPVVLPPTPLKRKFGASTPTAAESMASRQDDDNVDELRGAAAELLPAAMTMRDDGGGGGGDTVPATPQEERTQLVEITPLTTQQQNEFSNALVRRMRRYAKLTTNTERFEEAKNLIPALTQYQMPVGALDVVAIFKLPTSDTVTKKMLNAPFVDRVVWRDAFRRAFPRFVSEFAGDLLPDFYGVDESEYDAIRRWRVAQTTNFRTADEDNNHDSSETSLSLDEPAHGTWQQWRHYFVLVDDLFKQMMMLTVIALRKAPRGEWHEYYCRVYNDVTCHQIVDRPEEAIFVLPEQFGVVGDVYDLALSTFDPMAALPAFALRGVPPWPAERFSIVRWYDAVLWEEYSKKYTGLPEGGTETREEMFVKRNRSTLEYLRFFVRMAAEQFLRSRYILKTGRGDYQWAGYGNQLDEIMFDAKPSTELGRQIVAMQQRQRLLEASLARDTNTLQTVTKLLKRRQQQQRKRTRFALGIESETASSDSGIESELPYVGYGDEDEQQLQERLGATLERTQKSLNEIEAIVAEMSALKLMARENADKVVQIAHYETSVVSEPSIKLPLKAEDFALAQRSMLSSKQQSRSDVTDELRLSSPLREAAAQQSVRGIEFSEASDEDDQAAASATSQVLRPRYATLFAPNTHNKRITYQAKISVLLTHTLRFYTGWIDTDNGVLPKPFLLEYMRQLEYRKFVHESLFSAEHTSSFVIWLMQRHIEHRDTGSTFRNYMHPSFATQPDIEPDDEILVQNSLAQTLTEENLSAVERIAEIVQKKAYPYLAEYAASAAAVVATATTSTDEES